MQITIPEEKNKKMLFRKYVVTNGIGIVWCMLVKSVHVSTTTHIGVSSPLRGIEMLEIDTDHWEVMLREALRGRPQFNRTVALLKEEI